MLAANLGAELERTEAREMLYVFEAERIAGGTREREGRREQPVSLDGRKGSMTRTWSVRPRPPLWRFGDKRRLAEGAPSPCRAVTKAFNGRPGDGTGIRGFCESGQERLQEILSAYCYIYLRCIRSRPQQGNAHQMSCLQKQGTRNGQLGSV